MNAGRSTLAMAGLALGVLLAPGCAPQAGLPAMPPQADTWDEPLINRPYRIQVGDVLGIRFLYATNLDDEVVVRPDGRISLMPIDEVEAAGLPPDKLDKILTERFAKVVNQPDLSVIVRQCAAQRAFVGGEVKAPQMIKLDASMSVFTAIMQAGGPMPSGTIENVLLIRRGEGNKCHVRKVDIRKVMSRGAGDIRLAAFDVVYVPRTIIADVGLFVEQYINSIVPRALGFNFIYDLNPEVQVQD
jgi:protein involved in polysaccharide export with SLBB domain